MERKINVKARARMVRAMDEIATSLNDEDLCEWWLMTGVADGDIKEDTTDEDLACYYEDDAKFADLMNDFIRIMHRATVDGIKGTLYCDHIINKKKEEV